MSDHMLKYFTELALDCLGMWSWSFDQKFRLKSCNCPNPVNEQAAALFRAQRSRVEELRQRGLFPAVIAERSGLLWAVTFRGAEAGGEEAGREEAGDEETYLVLGPVRPEKSTPAPEFCPAFSRKQDFENFFFCLPAAGKQELERYASMLHKSVSDTAAPVHWSEAEAPVSAAGLPPEDASTILLLASLQDKIRRGDLSYRELMNEALTNHRFVQSLGAVTMESAKDVATLAIDMCCQAALEGGLAERSVNALRSQYLSQLKNISTGYDIARLCDSVMSQLVRQIRRFRGDTVFSEPVQACCTYVNEHICDRLTVAFLAKNTGYSPDHLSRKFREEFGEPLKDYILRTKIQRAQLLLTTTAMPVSEIASMLSFSSGSHFTKVFEQFTKESPSVYRTVHSHLG